VNFRNRNWDIVGKFHAISLISYAVILAGAIALVAHHGLRLGLSFTGGTDVTVRFTRPADAARIATALGAIGVHDAEIVPLAKSGDPQPNERYTITTQTAFGNDTAPLWTALGGVASVDRAQSSIESVGPSLSHEYLARALIALGIAIAIQFVYIAFRFGWNYIFGLVVVIALVRDSAMMIGIYAIANRRADDAFLAAVLTVIGYSVMDTIVILDRIRENARIMAHETYEKIVNTSILQTMSRSLNTLATVVVTLIALLAFGGASLQNFAFALLVGICSGGYHSIFYSAPLVARLRAAQRRRAERVRTARRALESGEAAAGPSDRDAVVAARRDRRERAKGDRTAPVAPRYKRKRAALPTEPELDPLDAQERGWHDEQLALGHETLNLVIDDESEGAASSEHAPDERARAEHAPGARSGSEPAG